MLERFSRCFGLCVLLCSHHTAGTSELRVAVVTALALANVNGLAHVLTQVKQTVVTCRYNFQAFQLSYIEQLEQCCVFL